VFPVISFRVPDRFLPQFQRSNGLRHPIAMRGSQTGSQPREMPGGAGRRPATTYSASWPNRRRQATSSDRRGTSYKPISRAYASSKMVSGPAAPSVVTPRDSHDLLTWALAGCSDGQTKVTGWNPVAPTRFAGRSQPVSWRGLKIRAKLMSSRSPTPLSAVGGGLCQIRFHRIRRSITLSLIA
jgi:hypothetical protein